MQQLKLLSVAAIGALGMQIAVAAPTPEEAAQLGKTLTPLGAIKAGNKEGTIPEWTGGLCTPPANYKPKYGLEVGGAPYVDPYPDDKPLFKITAENFEKYADKLDDGSKELFRRFPKTFYINVYPTRRSACHFQWVYDNTVKNVMRPRIVGGDVASLTGAHAQFPFPIPKNGVEAIYNQTIGTPEHPYNTSHYLSLMVDVSGRRSVSDSDSQHSHYPYWDPSTSGVPEDKPYYIQTTFKHYPPGLYGNVMLFHRFLRADQKGDPVWSYIPGQRRVRLAPEFAYDGVAPSAGGTMLFDEARGFAGKMDRFDFKLLGRKEYYIPYNSSWEKLNKAEAATPNHVDPEAMRWELHRVWVVEATLKPGERHVQKKKIFYIDEDSWQLAVYNGLDHAGKVHHLFIYQLTPQYDKPSVGPVAFNTYDLSKGAYTHWMFGAPTVDGITAEGGRRALKPIPARTFSPDGLAGIGVR